MKKNGRVSGWQDARGYGFILPDDGSARVFLHHSAIALGQARPSNGDIAHYVAATDTKKGLRAQVAWTRPMAEVSKKRRERARVTQAFVNEKSNREKNSQAFWLTILFALGLAYSVLTHRVPPYVPITYVLLGVITFFTYWKDKRAALRGGWRTPESTLHVLSLIGGWPGALVAQRVFRHKSVKGSFRVMFWASMILNLLLFVYLFRLQS